MNEHIQNLLRACGAAGYSPVGADDRTRIIDACNYVKANSAPAGDEGLWVAAESSCSVIDEFMARPLP